MRLDVRAASFLPMDDAVGLTGMAYGGITGLACRLSGRRSGGHWWTPRLPPHPSG